MKIKKIVINGTTYEVEGKSAYELACEHGFMGSEAEWLASLKGEPGEAGSGGGGTGPEVDALTAELEALKKELRWIKAGSEGNTYAFDTVTETAFVRTVPANACKYAILERVGGRMLTYAETQSPDYAPVCLESITIKNKDQVVVASYTIPQAVKDLPEYGYAISDAVSNYIDFEKKIYVQMCEARWIEESDFDRTDIKPNMSWTFCCAPLAEPIVTDISEHIPFDNVIEVESGGVIEFGFKSVGNGDFGYGIMEYNEAAPSTITYQVKI